MWNPPTSDDEDSDWEEQEEQFQSLQSRKLEAEKVIGGPNRNEWRYDEIKERIISRETQKRNEVYLESSRNRLIEKQRIEHDIAKSKLADKRELGEQAMLIVKSNHSHEIFMRRSDQFWQVDENVKLVKTGVNNLMKKSNVFKPLVSDLERRIIKLKDQNNEEPDLEKLKLVKPANDLVLEELGISRYPPFILQCRSCGRRCAAELRNYHESICDGQGEIAAGEEEEDEEKVDNAKAAQGKVRETKLEICPVCFKKYTLNVFDKHKENCLRRYNFRQNAKKKIETPIEGCSVPSPPTHVLGGEVTYSSFTISWVAPLYDGGRPIYDYEISFQKVHKVKEGKKIHRTYEDMPKVSTSRWVSTTPVASNGLFVIQGLEANTEYVNFFVRSVNEVGQSRDSNAVETITTLSEVAPSPPNLLTCDSYSANQITLSWCEPFDSGGCKIVDYELSYEYLKREAISGAGAGGATWFKPFQVVLNVGSVNKFIKLDNLIGDVEYCNFTVKAVNSVGLISQPSNVVPIIRTTEASRYQKVFEEIQRVKATRHELIDTNFYSGSSQRLKKSIYLPQLEAELASLPPDPIVAPPLSVLTSETKDRSISIPSSPSSSKNGRSKEAKDLEEEMKNPKFASRYRKFLERISLIKDDIKNCDDVKFNSINKRTEDIQLCLKSQNRILELRFELDRASNFSGKLIDSDIIHGKMQRFWTSQLKEDLEWLIEDQEQIISDAKAEMVEIEDRLEFMKNRKMQLEDNLKERKAALQDFQKEAGRNARAAKKLVKLTKSGLNTTFNSWVDFVDVRRHEREVLGKLLKRLAHGGIFPAIITWKAFVDRAKRREMNERDTSGGIGSQMLERSKILRETLEKEIGNLLNDTKINVAKRVELLSMASKHQEELKGSVYFDLDLKEDERIVKEYGEEGYLAIYNQGVGYYKIKLYDKAMECFEIYLGKVQNSGPLPDAKQVCHCYCKMADCNFKMGNYEKAIVLYDRAVSVSKEVSFIPGKLESCFGLASLYVFKKKHKAALYHAECALDASEIVCNKAKESDCCQLLSEIYKGIFDDVKSEIFLKRSLSIKKDLDYKLLTGKETLETLRANLIGVSASTSDAITIERVSNKLPKLRDIRKEKEKIIKKLALDLTNSTNEEILLLENEAQLKAEIEKANKYEDKTIDTAVLTGNVARYQVEELKAKLVTEEKKIEEKKKNATKKKNSAAVLLSNCKDDLNELEMEIKMEEGPLMKSVNEKRIIRCVALNSANQKGDDVTGGTSGTENFVMAFENHFQVCNLWNGGIEKTFYGDEKGRHLGPLVGHTKAITCIFYYNNKAYTGSVDKRIRVWEINTGDHESASIACLEGHTATVWTIQVDVSKIVSGASDNEIRVWDIATYECLKVIRGHSKAIRCLDIGVDYIISGSTDGLIKFWDFDPTVDHPYKTIELDIKLTGHECPVTCVKYATNEIISGARDGTIAIWHTPNARLLRKCFGHKTPVVCLQFDAVKIVSGGSSGAILVHDIATGDVIISLRGHTDRILSLQFDSQKLLTVSADNTYRYWHWAGHNVPKNRDKYHILENRETLPDLSKMYHVSIENLMKWNHVKDPKLLYSGQRIIVKKRKPKKKKKDIEDDNALIEDKKEGKKVKGGEGKKELEKELEKEENEGEEGEEEEKDEKEEEEDEEEEEEEEDEDDEKEEGKDGKEEGEEEDELLNDNDEEIVKFDKEEEAEEDIVIPDDEEVVQ